MNTKRILFVCGYVILIGLLAWWLIASIIKATTCGSTKIGIRNIDTPVVDTSKIGVPAKVTYSDHTLGPADAPVTLIEYGDFECQLCSEYAAIVRRLVNEHGETLRFVFRHFPLSQHSSSWLAAEAAEAASRYGKFWDMYEILTADRASWADLSSSGLRTALTRYAVMIGLDERQFLDDLDSPAAKQKIESDRAGGLSIHIISTPSFFVNGRAIQIPKDYSQFKEVIDAAVRGGNVTRSDNTPAS
jgi:protein-disulfide isomerase